MTYTLTIHQSDAKPVETRGTFEQVEAHAQRYVEQYGGSAEIREMTGTLVRYIDDTGRDWTNKA
jgi:hypothetical protein